MTTATQNENIAKYWLKQLDLSNSRVEKWLEKAKGAVRLYEAQKREDDAFNILYSNTETLLPALYNALPRPVAQRRFKDADPVAKAVCDTLTRALEYTTDSPDAEYEAFDDVVRSAVLGALVPGLGVTWFRYDFESEQSEQEPAVPEGIAAEGTTFTDGDPTDDVQKPVPQEQVTYEAVCAQNVDYNDFRWGYARSWKSVPWCARRHVMTKTDVKEQFGPEVAALVTFEEPQKSDGDDVDSSKGDANNEENRGSAKVADVWEIWHKAKKQVVFVSPQYKAGPLEDPKDDPLGLSGFFPCPEPLQFTAKVSSLVPTPLYSFYERQAKELNKVTIRIGRVMDAMKVRGFYNGQLTELTKLLEQGDNTLLAAANATAFEGKDLANQIWLMPLQELAGVLQTLVQQRQQIKQTIYEITGISDILRGSTVASETATAQNLKSQWGTLRLKRLQKKVQVYVRSSMRIQTEIIAGKFSMQTLAEITGLPYMMPEQKAQAQQALQQVKQQQMMQPPPPPGPSPAQPSPTGQPPTPGGGQPPPDPMAQQVQQLEQQVQQIDWGQVMQTLRSNVLRGYKIDIETNSTIDADATEDRENINELMQALATSMQSFGPAIQEGVLPMGAFRAILLAIARRYEFGAEVEEELNSMPQQLPQKPDPAVQKAQMDMQQSEKEGQMKLQQMQLDLQTAQMEAELKRAAMQQKAQLDERKHQLMLEKMNREEVMAQQEHQRKLQEMAMQAAMPQKPPGGRSNGQAKARA
jgi:hypothetical protein